MTETLASAPLEILEKNVVYREQGGAEFAVTKVLVQSIKVRNRFTVHYASVQDGRLGAVCVTVHKNRLLMARHWRVATESWEWEFPRGMGASDESIEQTALRELHEETGMHTSPDSVTLLQYMHADTGVLKDSIGVVSLTLEDKTPDEYQDWELSDCTWVTPERIEQMIAGGEIVDGITIAAYTIWRVQSKS